MSENIDFTKVRLAREFQMDPPEEQEGVRTQIDEVTRYLGQFSWCKEVREIYVGLTYPGIIGVFLCHIRSVSDQVPEWVWVVVGDVPPAYIATDEATNPAAALDAYIGEMEQWVEAARSGRSTEDLIPVNAPLTPEYAQMLASRLQFLDQEILSEYADDLKA